VIQRQASNPLLLGVAAVLSGGPAHPYAVAAALRRRGLAGSVRVNAGALYHCFRVLVERGWVESVGVSRVGGRPARESYELTALGRTALRDQLRALLALVDTEARFQAGLAFIGLLSPEEAVEVLRERAWTLQRSLRAGREGYRGLLARSLPRGAVLDLEYPLMQGENELVWLRQLIQEIEGGEVVPASR